MYDVAVIGAGVVGGMIARELSRYDLKICIIEKENDVAMGATKANSAIVHAGFDAKEGSLKAKLNVKGSEMMAEVAKELGVKYKNNGSIVIAFNDEDRKTVEGLLERGKKNGVKDLRILEKDELKKLEPNISDNVVCALYAPTGAIICPYREPMHGFREMSIDEKNEVIKKDSAYGRIICRCETVTEGEILKAIRTNPQPFDLDGVKRRTRAQMGRCQGGFCSPYIMELLSEELEIPFETITKNGCGSALLVGETK